MSSHRKYIIDYDKLARWLTPWFLRSPFMMSWLKALMEPVKTVYGNFKDHRTSSTKEARTTSQTIVLESALNDEFDDTQRRIRVINQESSAEYTFFESESTVLVYTYLESETIPGGEETYLFFEGESSTSLPEDFRVIVPSSFSAEKNQRIRNFVENYKMVGFSFDVV